MWCGSSCHLRLWPFLCNQGLRTFYHISAHSSNIWRKSRKIGQSPVTFEPQSAVPKLSLNESHGELLLHREQWSSAAGLPWCTCSGTVGTGSCAKNQDPHLLVHHVGLQSWEAWGKLMGLLAHPLLHIMALKNKSKAKQPTSPFF